MFDKKCLTRMVCMGTLCAMLMSSGVWASVGGTVAGEVVNVRQGPALTAEILARVQRGAAVTVLAVEGDFYRINFNGNENVYIARQFVDVNQPYGVVRGTNVNVRSGPTRQSEVLGRVNEGHVLAAGAIQGEWLQVNFQGQAAYIHRDFFDGEALANLQPAADTAAPADGAVADEGVCHAVVTAGVGINLREGPSTDYAVVRVVPPGYAMEKIERRGDWIRVDFNGSVGYVSGEFVSVRAGAVPVDAADTVSATDGASDDGIYHAVVTAGVGINLREGPSTDYAVVRVIPSGRAMEKIEWRDDWVKVDFNGSVGYVSGEFVSVRAGAAPVDTAALVDEMIAYAEQFLGTPYRWGGTNLNTGVDCSGFVFSVMRHFGIHLYRSSRDMARNGYPITRDAIRRGDLLFFANNGTVISHVGIYLGNGRMIHSTEARNRGVSFSYLSSDHNRRTFHSARRVIL